MNITINLSTANLEIVNSNIISKLYNLISGNSLHNVTLSGNLYSAKGYKLLIDTLVDRFSPNLIITVPVEGQYLIFTDSEMENILKNTIGDGEGVTLSLLKNADPNSSLGLNNNTSITDTRELCLIEGTSTNGGFCYLCTNIKTLGIPKNVTSFGYGYTEGISPERLVIGDMVNFCKTSFGSHNFSRYNEGNGVDICTLNNDGSLTTIKNLVLPSNVLFEDDYWCMPFDNANIDSVVIPAGTNVIGGFQASKLKSMTIELGSQATIIQANAFYKCSDLVFDIANLPQSINTIRQLAFKEDPKVVGILNLPNLISLENEAFSLSGITKITELGNVTEIPSDCFNSCRNISTVTLPQTCTKIKNGAFYNSTISSIDLSNVISFMNAAFKECKLLSTIGSFNLNLTTLPNECFRECTNLVINASILPSGITKFDENFTFYKTKIYGTLNLPNLTSSGHHTFAETNISSVVDLGSIATIPPAFFENCSNLTSVVIPNTVVSIREYAFNGDSNLTSITLPPSLTDIGEWAFQNCSGLTSITLPTNVVIKRAAFSGSSLISVTIPNGANFESSQLFRNCTALTNITIGNSVTAISGETFDGCSSLQLVIIGSGVKRIDGAAFRNCSNLSTITLSEGLTHINGEWTFRGCMSLHSILLPSTLTYIGATAFALCGLNSITIPAAVLTIESNAFGLSGSNSNFVSIIFEGTTPPIIGSGGLGGIWDNLAQNPNASPNRRIYVPYGCKNTYIADSYFSTLSSIIEELPLS